MDRRFIGSALALLAMADWGLAQTPTSNWYPQPITQVQAETPSPTVPTPAEAPKSGGGDQSGSCCSPDSCIPLPNCGPAPCGPPGRVWVEVDYLMWWLRGSPLPPLVTASPSFTPLTQAGVLGTPGTVILFGDQRTDTDFRSGFRVNFGYWLNDCQTVGIEGNYFNLENRGSTLQAGSPGTPGSVILARPFFNTVTGMPDAQLIAFPGLLAGAISVSTHNNLLGAEALYRCNVCCGCDYRVDLLAGYRFLKLDEGLTIRENLTAINPLGLVPFGTQIRVVDQFDVKNEFHGGEIGGVAEYRHHHWSLGLLAKVALGDTRETVTINGLTQVTAPGQPTITNVGGLLAQKTNIGHYSRDVFAVVPEFDVTIGYQVTPHLRATAGYNFIYWSDVVRPGDQVDLTVNASQIPPGTLTGPARPAFAFRSSDFWAQGIHLGLEFRY